MDLKNKVAVVTGGASGLGYATCQKIIANGGKVAIFDRNAEMALKAQTELGKNAISATVNVTEEDSVKSAIDVVMNTFGAIHINVNCAGIGAPGRTLGREGPLSLDLFNLVIQVNLIGTFNTLRLCAQKMAANSPIDADGERGVIINTASVAAFDGQIGQVAYSASKGGIVATTLPLARDLSRDGIRVCTIAPGIFETPMMAGASDKVRLPLIEMVQFPHRLGQASEFAQMAVQIIENCYLNGEVIRLDGGIRMQPR